LPGTITLAWNALWKSDAASSSGAKLKKIDVSAAKEIKDARIFQEGRFYCVRSSASDMAEKASGINEAGI